MSTFEPNQSVRVTKRLVDGLESPTSGQTFVRDSDLKGFAVRVTPTGTRAFVVEKRIDGRLKRITLGRYPELTVEQARREAQKLLGKIALGIDPQAEKAERRFKGITLAQAFADFLKARKDLKPRTRYDYERVMAVALPDWQERPLVLITKDAVARRHRELGESRGPAYANLTMRVLRAVLNYAMEKYERPDGRPLLERNPVEHLSRTRAWFRVSRRQTVIKVHQLPAWFAAVEDLREADPRAAGDVAADYLQFVLFSGLRKNEALGLTWEDVDFDSRTVFIADPKNREPLTLPLSDFLVAILRRRGADRVNRYVFPGKDGQGHLVEPKRQVERVVKASGVEFTLHDLRRTFITVAESLDLSPYAIKRLVNHKLAGDVTAGYIVSDVERLREPMQKVTRFLLSASERAGQKVISLDRNARMGEQG